MAQRCPLIICLLCLTILPLAAALPAAAQIAAKQQRKQQEVINGIERIVEQVREQHGLTIVYRDLAKESFSRKRLEFKEAEVRDYPRVYRYIKVLQEELAKYPPGFFDADKLQRIYILKSIFNEEKNAQGIYDYRAKVMFLDFGRKFGGVLAQRHNIHHEIFHVIDTNSFFWTQKEAWEDLNDPAFKYVRKGKVIIDPVKNDANYFAPNRKGFVTYYAMMSPYEDKAEVFACLFIPAQNRLIHKWAKKDRILQKKIDYIKDFLKFYSSGAIDDAFLENLAQ